MGKTPKLCIEKGPHLAVYSRLSRENHFKVVSSYCTVGISNYSTERILKFLYFNISSW
jgi:hypothetical protein